MKRPLLLKQVALSPERSLKTLVENRTAYSLARCELNVFETSLKAENVSLTFGDFVVTGMLRGKKIMYLFDEPGFDYYPGETVLVPGGETMHIDFPEARADNPTQCIALAIDQQKIRETVHFLNEKYPSFGEACWNIDRQNLHLDNSPGIADQLSKLITICTGNMLLKDVLADLALQELIVNVIQTQNLKQLTERKLENTNRDPMHFIADFIRRNVAEELDMEQLSKKVHMSRPTFYRSFKKRFGISPLEYILQEKIRKGKEMLNDPSYTVKTAAWEAGFRDVNYFIRLFKKLEAVTPKQYQQLLIKGQS